jgi:hypothetical protein
MPLFTVNRTSTALSTSNDYLTIVAANNRPLRIYIVDIKGDGVASAANEVGLYRSTVGVGGGGGITPAKVNSGSAAAQFVVYTTWSSSQPTLGDLLWRFSMNANGGIDKFVAIPGAEIPVPVSGQISIRSIDGTSNAIVNLLIEEVDG